MWPRLIASVVLVSLSCSPAPPRIHVDLAKGPTMLRQTPSVFSADEPLPHPSLAPVRSALEAHYDVPLGGIGLNYYRDGRDSVAPHRDRELRHLDDTLITIVTLGAQRPFLLRPRGVRRPARHGRSNPGRMGARSPQGEERRAADLGHVAVVVRQRPRRPHVRSCA